MKLIVGMVIITLFVVSSSAGEMDPLYNAGLFSSRDDSDSALAVVPNGEDGASIHSPSIPGDQVSLVAASHFGPDSSSPVPGSVIHVGPLQQYQTIYSGIVQASDGDTILIDSSIYPEHVCINKSVHLMASNHYNPPVIDGCRTGYPVTIQKSGVTLQDISVINSVYDEGRDSGYGIFLEENVCNTSLLGVTVANCQRGIGSRDDIANRLQISDSCIYDIAETGIDFYTLQDSFITGSEMRNCSPSIIADVVSNTIISNNIFSGNHLKGPLSFLFVSGSDISYNLFSDNEVDEGIIDDPLSAALMLNSLTNTTILSNYIKNTKGFALYCDISSGKVQNNVLVNNTYGTWFAVSGDDISESHIYNNTVDNKPLLYFAGRDGFLLDGDALAVQPASVIVSHSQDCIISNLKMNSPDGFGLLVRDGDNITVANNEISGYMDQGILFFETTNGLIHKNNLSLNAFAGIGLLECSDIVVEDNTFSGNNIAIATTATLCGASIRRNEISEGYSGIIFDQTKGCSSKPNRIDMNHISDVDIGIAMVNTIHAILENNQVINTGPMQSCGISIMGSSQIEALGNTINGTEGGIQLDAYGGTDSFCPSFDNCLAHNAVKSLSQALILDPNSEYVYNNSIFLNDFITLQETGNHLFSAANESANWFLTPKPVVYRYRDTTWCGYLGNYWSGYFGPDSNGDGVGQEDYEVNSVNYDAYPLVNQTSFYTLLEKPDYFLNLYEGWNCAAVPRILCEGKNTGSIFSHLDTEGRSILTFNAIAGKWDVIGSDTPILPLYGYWIYVGQDSTVGLYFKDNPISVPPQRSVYQGWNSIGVTGSVAVSARDLLISVRDIWTTAIGFDASRQRYNTSIINGGDGIHSDTRLMYPGTGYWIWMSDNGTISSISESGHS
ncbi:MAG: right-handed parallel beta-helix repeat-containing protein [Methanospirillaceae archaeon]|nr:right-handed parallel beta-helix repeat-containing protein [Methanospirillaceae archaeon]